MNIKRIQENFKARAAKLGHKLTEFENLLTYDPKANSLEDLKESMLFSTTCKRCNKEFTFSKKGKLLFPTLTKCKKLKPLKESIPGHLWTPKEIQETACGEHGWFYGVVKESSTKIVFGEIFLEHGYAELMSLDFMDSADNKKQAEQSLKWMLIDLGLIKKVPKKEKRDEKNR